MIPQNKDNKIILISRNLKGINLNIYLRDLFNYLYMLNKNFLNLNRSYKVINK